MPSPQTSNRSIGQLHKQAMQRNNTTSRSLPRMSLARCSKQAGVQPPSQGELNRDALRTILHLGLAGLGTGATVRGLSGLRDLLQRGQGAAVTSSVPQTVPIPLPTRAVHPRLTHDTDYELPEDDREKVAQKDWASDWGPAFNANAGGGITWWQVPAGAALGAGGLYGGWKLMDALMAARRRSETSGELEDAQKEYQNALQEQYNVAMMAKDAADDSLSLALDQLADQLEKQGGFLEDLLDTGRNAAHGFGGAYSLAMLMSALGSGYAGHQWAKNRSSSKLLEKALRRRARERSQPQPIYARPDVLPSVA